MWTNCSHTLSPVGQCGTGLDLTAPTLLLWRIDGELHFGWILHQSTVTSYSQDNITGVVSPYACAVWFWGVVRRHIHCACGHCKHVGTDATWTYPCEMYTTESLSSLLPELCNAQGSGVWMGNVPVFVSRPRGEEVQLQVLLMPSWYVYFGEISSSGRINLEVKWLVFF